MSTIEHAATIRRELMIAGFAPLPITPATKAPPLKGWQTKHQTNDDEIALWSRTFPRDTSTGILTRTVPALDVDILNPDAAKAVEELVREHYQEGGLIAVRIGLPPKRAVLFRVNDPFAKYAVTLVPPDGGADEKVEFLCDGQQLVVDGIHPKTGEPYAWFGAEIGQFHRDDLPYIHEQQARELVDDIVALLVRDFGYTIKSAQKTNGADQQQRTRTDSEFGALNERALANLHLWVPKLFPTARRTTSGGYRVAPADRGRGWQEDLSFTAQGIKDFGVADQGDPRLGRRSPIDIVMDWEHIEFDAAVQWLERALGEPPRQDNTAFKISTTPHDFPNERSIARWDFLYGAHLLRRTVSGTVATGATGKSSMSLVEALAMTSGKFLLGVPVPRPLRVLWVNLEDNRNAVDKRIAAAMRHHKLKPEDIDGRLFTVAKGELSFKIATQARTVTLNEQVIRGLIAFLRENRIDMLSIDPFIKTHSVNENDNSAVSAVVDCYDSIAEQADCAISLWHHTRKGSSLGATVDSARGASAFIDACRSVRVLETMSKEEAQRQKIKNHRSYFRAFSGKLNFAPPTDQSDWYRFVSVQLDNAGTLFGGDGDSVGVVESWQHPGAVEVEIGTDKADAIKRALASGQWREDPRAAMWAGKAVGHVLGLDPEDDAAAIKKAIKKLIEDGVLKTIDGRTDRRKLCLFIVPADWTAVVTPIRAERSKESIRVVGPAPEGTVCAECHQGGDLLKIKLAVPGVKPEVLHKACAAKFFGAPS
jgi:hypothetical protein